MRAAALLALLLAGCGDDGKSDGVATTTTTAVPTTTTTEAATTTTTEAATTTSCPEPPAGSVDVDIDGDGAPERWLEVGSGASAIIYGLHRVTACDAVPVTFVADGSTAVFAVGATVGNVSGVSCPAGGGVQTVELASLDGVSYEGTRRTFALTPEGLAVTATEPLSLTSDDPAFRDLPTLRCPA